MLWSILLCCLCALWFFRQWRWLRLTSRIPKLPGTLPIIGVAYQTVGSPECLWKTIESWIYIANEMGGIVKVWIGPVLLIAVTEPGIGLTLLNSYLEKHHFYSYAASFMGEGLVTSSETALGLPSEAKNVVTEEYANAFSKYNAVIIKRITTIWLHPNFIYNRSFTKKEETEDLHTLKTMSAKVIATSKMTQKMELSNMSQNNINRRIKPFFELMMELDEKGELSDSEIRYEADTIIATGYDTMNISLIFLLVMLGSHAEVQDQSRQYLLIQAKTLQKLVYLEAIIKETLRLYPTVPLIARKADRNLKIGDFIIPNGPGVLVPLWGINRNKKYWGLSADEFNPERWLEPSTLPEDPAAFSSFSLGRRSCMGKFYAIMFLKTSLVHLLRTYRVKADHTKIKWKYEFVLIPTSGHFISIEFR